MQQINIKTSEANKEVVRRLTAKLPLGTSENVIARIVNQEINNSVIVIIAK